MATEQDEPIGDELLAAEPPADHIGPLATQLILARFNTQDVVLEGIQREVRRTNGRVTALEKVNASRQAVEVHIADERQTRRWRIDVWAPITAIVVGGILGDLGHVVHAW